jgi:hypothetical protein
MKLFREMQGLFLMTIAALLVVGFTTIPHARHGADPTLQSLEESCCVRAAEYESAMQTAFRQVADALVAPIAYSSQIPSQTSLIAAQRRRFDVATLRYAQGEDTYLSVLLAQRELYGARQGFLQVEYNLMASRIALYQALGGRWK